MIVLWREAQLHVVGTPGVISLDLHVVDEHQSFRRLHDVVKFHNSADGALIFIGKPLYVEWAGGSLLSEQFAEIIIIHLRDIVEVQSFGGRDDSVLSGAVRSVETILPATFEIHEAGATITAGHGVLDEPNELRLGVIQPHLASEQGEVFDVCHDSVHGVWIAHFYHDTASSSPRLDEVDPQDVAVLAEEVEHTLAGHFI